MINRRGHKVISRCGHTMVGRRGHIVIVGGALSRRAIAVLCIPSLIIREEATIAYNSLLKREIRTTQEPNLRKWHPEAALNP